MKNYSKTVNAKPPIIEVELCCRDCSKKYKALRYKGHYHLGRCLKCDDDYNIFHGRPTRAERRRDALEDLKSRGLISETTLCAEFKYSDPAHERHNASEWTLARKWSPIKPGTQNLYIWGANRLGKTRMAQGMLLSAFDRNYSIAEVTPKLYVDRSFKSEHATWCSEVENAKVLLLDDIDKLSPNEHAIIYLWDLLDRREKHAKLTITTSNMPPENLGKHLARISPSNSSIAAGILGRLEPYENIRLIGPAYGREAI